MSYFALLSPVKIPFAYTGGKSDACFNFRHKNQFIAKNINDIFLCTLRKISADLNAVDELWSLSFN